MGKEGRRTELRAVTGGASSQGHMQPASDDVVASAVACAEAHGTAVGESLAADRAARSLTTVAANSCAAASYDNGGEKCSSEQHSPTSSSDDADVKVSSLCASSLWAYVPRA